MKRFFAMIFVFVAALALVACKGGEKFDVDGVNLLHLKLQNTVEHQW